MAKRNASTKTPTNDNNDRDTTEAQATDADEPIWARHLLGQTGAALGIPSGLEPKEVFERVLPIMHLIEGIEPQDALEGMLVAQMVATHNASMECLCRAMRPRQNSLVSDQNFKHAEKLLALFTRQMVTLDKHRGKGQQNITVKHVQVEAGGQAIVGTVETGRGSEPR